MEGGGDVCTFLAPTLRSLYRGFCIFVTYLGTPALSLPFSPFSVRAPPRSCLCPPSVRPAPRVPARSDRATPGPPLCMESSAKMESGGAGPQPQQPFLPPAACQRQDSERGEQERGDAFSHVILPPQGPES